METSTSGDLVDVEDLLRGPPVHRVTFQLPVFTENYGRGFITMPQECENVNWRVGLLGSDDNGYGLQLMCNQEDRSNFWSIDMQFELWLRKGTNQQLMKHGLYMFRARKFLKIKIPMNSLRLLADEKNGTFADFYIKVNKKKGIRDKIIHDFSTFHEHLHNLTMYVQGKPIHCNKEIVALNSEVFVRLLYPEGLTDVEEIELPKSFKYDQILRLVKVFYNDSDALSASNIDETLSLATNLKSVNARQRCERWISKTPTMSAQTKMTLAEKYGLVELQNECVSMLKTSQQVQRLFEHPHDFTDNEIADLMNKVTLSIVGHSYEMGSSK